MLRAFVRSHGPALLAAGLFLLLSAPLQAGPIFVPGQLDGDRFTPEPGVPCHCCTLRYSTTNLTVEETTAHVQVEEIVDGPEKAGSTVCVIPLPDGATGSGIRVTIHKPGAEPALLADATFLPPQKARTVYEAIARSSGLTKLLAFAGRPAILVPGVILQGRTHLNVSFTTPIRKTQGVAWLTCPMPAASFSTAPVDRVTLTTRLSTKAPLRSIFSPTHPIGVVRKGPTEATATVRSDHWSGMDDFRLYWVADQDDLGLRVLAYRNSEREDGYFMLLGNPTGSAGERAVAKDVIFVVDTSGSMRGEKIEQARAAMEYCLDHLHRGDRFNVITFGTEVLPFRDDLVELTPATQTAAREFVENIAAHGQTNIAGALAKALTGKAAPGRERIMIFLTDGAPTVGERSPEKILEQARKANTAGTKIFVMGVGNDVNAHLLDLLAEATDGSSEYVAPKEELDAKVATLYDRLAHPVLSSVRVSFGESGAKSVLPSKVPVLFKGSEIMMVGRYRKAGKHTFTISGTLSGKPTSYTCAVDLPAGASETLAAGDPNEFLAPLWAARQIGYLLQEIRLHGANKELVEEVVRLSKQYGIVTEYTEFIAAASAREPAGPGMPAALPPAGAIVAEASKRLDMARREQAGQWAVNQAFNDRQLQNRVAGGSAANTYRDRRGREATFENIHPIGQRAFYLREGQWVDAEEVGPRKTRVVKLLSPEYFELLQKDATFARAQRLGWALSINVGNERIVVEKDGKQKDESLIPKTEPEQVVPGPGGPNQLQIPGPFRNQFQPNRGGPNQQIPGLQLPLNRDR